MAGRAAVGWWAGGSALNRGPQLGFHNDISGGQAEPSTVQIGKLRRGLLQCLRKGGASHQLLRATCLSHEDTMTRSWSALSVVTQRLDGDTGMEGSWVTWPQGPLYSWQTRGAPSPTSAAGRGRAGLRRPPARLPLLMCLRKAHFSTCPLFPAWRELGAQSKEEGSRGDREPGSRVRGEVGRSPHPTGGPGTGRGPQPPCSVDMKRTLSWSRSW